MNDYRLTAILAIAQLPQVGERRIGHVLEQARAQRLPLAAVPLLPAQRLSREFRLPGPAVSRLQAGGYWHQLRCAALAEQLSAAGVGLAMRGDRHYPGGWLRQAAPPPPLVWMHGDVRLLAQPTVAVLHSRLVTDRTVAATLQLVHAIAEEGLSLALAGMKTAHRIAAAAARARGIPRLVVLDRGLLAAFGGRLDTDPFGVGPRRAAFDPRRTLALSPFRPDDHAVPRCGRRRDGLLAALGDLVVLASARPGGETERVGLAALAGGQQVLAWDGGTVALRAAGALPLDAGSLRDGLRRWVPTPA